MATTFAPHNVTVLNQAQLIINDVAYGDATSKCTLVPTSATQTWTPISGKAQTKGGATAWSLQVTIGQDFALKALWRYLWENEGKSATFQIKPAGDTGPAFAGTINSLPAPQLGGDADAVATADITFPLAGKPTVTAWPTA